MVKEKDANLYDVDDWDDNDDDNEDHHDNDDIEKKKEEGGGWGIIFPYSYLSMSNRKTTKIGSTYRSYL